MLDSYNFYSSTKTSIFLSGYNYLFFFAICIFLSSCGDDITPESTQESFLLHYDGNNFDAPLFPVGSYEFAVRFPSEMMKEYENRSISEISIFLADIPAEMSINIAQESSTNSPSDPLYSQLVTDANGGQWNSITLDSPYELNSSTIWVRVAVVLDKVQSSVGCDEGPAVSNGDWLYIDDFMTWETFSNLSNGNESINWNIRVKID